MKIAFAIILVLHGLIHLIGFASAFGYGNIPLSRSIPAVLGVGWLFAGALLTVAGILLPVNSNWWIPGLAGAVLSQVLVFTLWSDARLGTIVNVLLAVVSLLAWGSFRFEQQYLADVERHLQHARQLPVNLLTRNDLQYLPVPVQRYMQYCGVVNKPRVNSIRVVFNGQMRSKDKDYMALQSEQYNFFDEPARLFFMKAKMFGLTVPGYHRYENGKASMDIRLFGWISIVKHEGPVMDTTETVTLFNDMCLMAPATLLDKRITWQEVDSNTVKATFNNQGLVISATLYFNASGQLVDFLSNDRTEVNEMKQYPFYTPVHTYQLVNGMNIMQTGDAIYQYPDGKFVYGKFLLKEIGYNL